MLDRGVLIVGGDSMIGGVFAERLANQDIRYWAGTRRPESRSAARPLVDLAKGEWRDLDRIDAEVAVICAAAARLAQCHADPEGTRAVNVTGTVALARALLARGMRVIYLSTNQVFDGAVPHMAADRAYAPATEYGRQKAEAEQTLLSLGPQVAVLRLVKVFGPDDALLTGWCRDLLAGKPITPFSDMTLAPVSAELASVAIQRMAEGKASGIYQLSAERDVTYAEFAAEMASRLGVQNDLIQPKQAAGPGVIAPPPAFTSMDGSRLRRVFGVGQPSSYAILDSEHQQA